MMYTVPYIYSKFFVINNNIFVNGDNFSVLYIIYFFIMYVTKGHVTHINSIVTINFTNSEKFITNFLKHYCLIIYYFKYRDLLKYTNYT